MASRCPQCSRLNPGDARYCYFDGRSLPGHAPQGPLHAGTLPFPMPFVFPDGQSCVNFNQFAMGCQKNWAVARDYLTEGHWAKFMQAIGRPDLASSAKLAQAEPDPDSALDRFLSKIPSETLQGPKLSVEPTSIHLGQLKPGADHAFDVTIGNLGMRLLRGTIRVDADWLTIGDGAPELFFQTPTETRIRVRIVGKHLRGEAKTKRAEISVTSNAGDDAIVVRADVPVVPFPEGLLAGATTPREVAVRAKEQPKAAAGLFERGAVEAWYRANSWEYPVQGPTGTGLGAIQQFFEALGLAKAPVVTVAPKEIQLETRVGGSASCVVTVSSAEQRPVFAHGKCSQPWLTIGTAVFAGNRVSLPIRIDSLPPTDQATIRAVLTVRANGNQKFLIPVTIAVLPARKMAQFNGKAKADDARTLTGASAATGNAFGMTRMVYWSGLLGSWSAFAGWLISEIALGHAVSQNVFLAVLMAALVGGAICGGLGLMAGLAARQWQGQSRKFGIGLVGGAVAGLVGASVGALLFAVLGENWGRALGWCLMGLAIGSWEGLYGRDRIRLRNGLIGGGVGGFLGGLLFNSLNHWIGGEMSSRALGFAVLGLCVGLLIGLVQVLLKDGWLTVTDGFRPGRQLILSQSLTTLGTSEKSSLIFIAYGAQGVEPTHAVVERLPSGAFVVRDRQTRTGTFVNGARIAESRDLRDGDLIEFGPNKVRFNERARESARTALSS